MLLNRKSVELLAPAGTWDALVAGVESGADAVYLGGKHFNMRMHEGEFNFDDALLKKAIDYAHEHGVRLYITLNNLISNEEIPALREYLAYLNEIRPDALLVQDFAVLELVHEMGIQAGGTMLLLAGCGAMGLGCIDIACHSPEKRPRRLVVTDVDDGRLARAAQMFGLVYADGKADGAVNGVDLHFVNTRDAADPVALLKSYNLKDEGGAGAVTSTGGGYDDIFLFAAVPALITQCSDLLSFGGCLNFFAGPTNQQLSASFNFYNIHYMNHHIVANSGGDVKDMSDSVDWIGKGYLHPEVMITHVGGLDSAFGATLDLLKVPGGKRLVYTHVKMPMTAISDFAKLGETDPFYAELDRLCTANKGLWCKAAEDYLLAHAPKLEIGEPKELVKERVIRIG